MAYVVVGSGGGGGGGGNDVVYIERRGNERDGWLNMQTMFACACVFVRV